MRRRRRVAADARRRVAADARCVLDSGGLSALTGRSTRARDWLRWIAEHRGTVIVPTPILVEIVTGDTGRDAEINRVLQVLARFALELRPADETTARLAGALRHKARADDGIDALVAAAAAHGGAPCALLTSDPKDLARLLVDHPQVAVRDV